MMPSKGNQALTRKMKSILVLSANQPKKAEPIPPNPNIKPKRFCSKDHRQSHFPIKTHRRNIMSMDMVIYRAYIQRPETQSKKQMITMVW